MKIIDLLNKIANYDEPIIKIKYQDIEFKFDGNTYRDNDGEGMSITTLIHGDLSNLNDEVEILEEKKIPKKVSLEIDKFEDSYYDTALIKVASKIDELIDYLDYLKSKGE